mmetsp:Transcript_55663/g.147660  ORF Transcript_55663/g.147660 Transcript_55663/m.147660 type:complete len:213 (-) Transcript_55663:225-863(-)
MHVNSVPASHGVAPLVDSGRRKERQTVSAAALVHRVSTAWREARVAPPPHALRERSTLSLVVPTKPPAESVMWDAIRSTARHSAVSVRSTTIDLTPTLPPLSAPCAARCTVSAVTQTPRSNPSFSVRGTGAIRPQHWRLGAASLVAAGPLALAVPTQETRAAATAPPVTVGHAVSCATTSPVGRPTTLTSWRPGATTAAVLSRGPSPPSVLF